MVQTQHLPKLNHFPSDSADFTHFAILACGRQLKSAAWELLIILVFFFCGNRSQGIFPTCPKMILKKRENYGIIALFMKKPH